MTAQITITTEADGSVSVRIPQQRSVRQPATEQPLVLSAWLAEKGMPVNLIRRTVSPLGKVIRTEYLKEHGQEPPKVERWIGGRNREVASYTVADRPLFDRAYRLYRATS